MELINRTDHQGQMEWSQFSIKILGVKFGNFILDDSNWDKISEVITNKISIWNRVRLSLRDKKIIVNQIFLSKQWYIGQVCTIPKCIKKEIERIYNALYNGKKKRPPWHLAQLSIWRGGTGFLDIDTQLKSLNIKWIQRLLNPTNAVWRDLMLYLLNLNPEF